MAELVVKKCILECDLINNIIVNTELAVIVPAVNPGDSDRMIIPRYEILPQIKERFLSEVVGDFWHTEEDQLQALMFFNDGSLHCQRRKTKYSFADGLKSWVSYTFTGYTQEQVDEIKNKIIQLIELATVFKELKIESKLAKIDEEVLFFEKTYAKRLSERNQMLKVSDWRILPDVIDSYPGEKDMWILWRQKLRELVIRDPESYPTPLDFFRSVKLLKWPVDPKTFREMYPDGKDNNGNPVEYLSSEDQWVERDTEASRDFVSSRLINILELRQRYVDSDRVVKKEVKELMQLIRVEDFIEAGIDYTKIYTEEDINDMAI